MSAIPGSPNSSRKLAFSLMRECAQSRCTHYGDGALSRFATSDNKRSV